VIEKMPSSSLDPSGYAGATGTKAGFDCTRKGTAFPPRFRMDPAIMARMMPEKYFAPPR
jgi:3-polyprenyl-4-hydroxybenzoate decarboxylase